MKTLTFILITAMFVVGSIFIGCQSSSDKVKDAQKKMEEANYDLIIAKQELDQAQKDSIHQFRKESEAKITQHEKSIAEFKARISSEKRENKAKYDKKLAELEQQNSDLKKSLDEFKEDGKEQWTAFKVKFNKDMDKLGEAFKGFVE